MPTVIFTCLASRCGRSLALTAASEFYAVVGMRNECGNKKTTETSVLDGLFRTRDENDVVGLLCRVRLRNQ